jgi:penicillin-binding protein 1A
MADDDRDSTLTPLRTPPPIPFPSVEADVADEGEGAGGAGRRNGGAPPGRPQGPRPRLRKLRVALILAGLGLLAAVSTVFGMMMAVASDLPALENRQEYRNARNSVLYDVFGKSRIGVLTGQSNRILLRSDQIAPVVKSAIISIEDRRFLTNPGVDLRGIARAFVQDVAHNGPVQGGSTITQQFVKNALEAQRKRTVFEKLREAALAYHLTRKWSKQKVLTEYLNAIYFGNGAYGIESAARTYFGREPGHPGCGGPARPCAKELKSWEAALLAGMVANPSAFDPLAHAAAATARRNLVLHRMLDQGRLSGPEYADATAQALPAPENILPPREETGQPYFTTWIKQQVVDRFGSGEAFGGGLKIRTTLDLDLQKAAEQAIRQRLGGIGPSAAMVVLDNRSGEVRAMVGGSDYRHKPFNLATQGQRQPGSAFKPFVLAAALQQGISPASTWRSAPQTIVVPGTGERFKVSNYGDRYLGSATLAQATAYSDNSVYAQVGRQVGPRRIARLARRMGIRTPVSRNYAISLGGLKDGVTPLDLAHAYQTLARRGQLVTGTLGAPDRGPVGVHQVEADGRTIRNEVRLRRVLPRGVAQTATALLESVLRYGTGTAAAIPGFAAGKTGTTENYGDAWFVGFDPRYTVAVWVGYPDRLRPMLTEYRGDPVAGGTYPALIWHDFMIAAQNIEAQRSARSGKGQGTDTTPGTTNPLAPATQAVPPPTAPPSSPTKGQEGPPRRGEKRRPAAPEATPAPTPAPGGSGPAGPQQGGAVAPPQ